VQETEDGGLHIVDANGIVHNVPSEVVGGAEHAPGERGQSTNLDNGVGRERQPDTRGREKPAAHYAFYTATCSLPVNYNYIAVAPKTMIQSTKKIL
jgi:hypothetical protein